GKQGWAGLARIGRRRRRDVLFSVAEGSRTGQPRMTDDRLLHILLVEDDEVDVMNVKRAFDKNKILNPLYVATNGLEALSMLRDGKVPAARRLVLLDLNMPGMGGIEFLRELRADPKLRMTPVVVLTTSGDEKDRIDAYDFHVAE